MTGLEGLGALGTETANPRTQDLDTMSTSDLVETMNAEDRSVPLAVRAALPAVTRAVEGAPGPVHLHLCFGYAAMVSERPEGYSFLPELADTPVDTVSVETAQAHLDPAQLRPLRGKGIALGVLDLSTPEVETPEVVADRVRRALDDVDVARLVLTSDCGLKYLPRDSAAGKMRSLVLAAEALRTEL